MSDHDGTSGIETPPPHFTLSHSARARRGAGWRGALGVAVVLAGGAALAIGPWARWARGLATAIGTVADRAPGAVTRARPTEFPAVRTALPCSVDGQLIGQFTPEDCARRNGVTSGSLQVAGAKTAPLASPAAPPPLPAPQPAAEPPAAREPGIGGPQARYYADASAPPRPSFEARVATRPHRYVAPWGPSYAEPAPAEAAREVPAQRASALAVRKFYTALGDGDGQRAAAVVVPEKRGEGALSAGELTRFYSTLRAPLRVTKIDPINDDTVFVRYEYVTSDDHLCLGSATVDTAHRDGDTLVNGVRPFNVC